MIVKGTTKIRYNQYRITHCTMRLPSFRGGWEIGKSSREVVLFRENDILVRLFNEIISDYQEYW